MTGITQDWLEAFTAHIVAGDNRRALSALERRSTGHAGTPKAEDKRAATAAVVRACGGRPEALAHWARWFAEQPAATAKELAAMLLVHSYPHHQQEALGLLRALCDDAHWEVREWGGSAAGELLDGCFEEVYPEVERWARDASQFVRRAVCLAVRGATNRRKPERCQPLFRLAEPLLPDRAEEVRRNLGPFAVGKLLEHYPDQTIEHVRRWAQSADEMVRWNAAMVFVSAAARAHTEAALEILSRLASDRRRLVWMAVGSALRNLVKRDPERVIPALRGWLADERRLPAALALRQTTVPER